MLLSPFLDLLIALAVICGLGAIASYVGRITPPQGVLIEFDANGDATAREQAPRPSLGMRCRSLLWRWRKGLIGAGIGLSVVIAVLVVLGRMIASMFEPPGDSAVTSPDGTATVMLHSLDAPEAAEPQVRMQLRNNNNQQRITLWQRNWTLENGPHIQGVVWSADSKKFACFSIGEGTDTVDIAPYQVQLEPLAAHSTKDISWVKPELQKTNTDNTLLQLILHKTVRVG